MPPDDWQSVRKILAIQLGGKDELTQLSSALTQLKRQLPTVSIALLCSSEASQVGLSLSSVDEVLLHCAFKSELGLSSHSPALLALIEMLRSERFGAAILFPQATRSPYPLAYVCYLAEIPIRVGMSDEFGGGLLSHWVKKPGTIAHESDDLNLFLLESVGLLAIQNSPTEMQAAREFER